MGHGIASLITQLREPTPVSNGEVATCSRGEIKHGKAGLSRAKLPTRPAAKRSPRRLVPSTLSPSTDPYPSFKGFSSDSDDEDATRDDSLETWDLFAHGLVQLSPEKSAVNVHDFPDRFVVSVSLFSVADISYEPDSGFVAMALLIGHSEYSYFP